MQTFFNLLLTKVFEVNRVMFPISVHNTFVVVGLSYWTINYDVINIPVPFDFLGIYYFDMIIILYNFFIPGL